LVSGSGSGTYQHISIHPSNPNLPEPTSKLLRLAPSVICNQQGSVIAGESGLQLVLGVLIDELLVVGNDGLGDGLTDGVNLGSVSTTGDSDANIDAGEFVETDCQEGFVDLKSQDLGLDEVERLSVDLNETLSCLFPSCQFSLPPSDVFELFVPCSGRRR
jgi:hypothetical protein